MNIIRTQNWTHTSQDEPRGYIDMLPAEKPQLKELWFHTGTACNLSCSFCLEGSHPGDTRLDIPKLADTQPYIEEAVALGVEQFSFTGGEPFLAKDLPAILHAAAQHAPCLVLTNGTAPLLQRIEQLKSLQATNHPISFRISIDYPSAEPHDVERGAGSFEQSWQSLQQLHTLGFKISIARQKKTNEDTSYIEEEYYRLFKQYQLPQNTPLIAFPEFHLPNSQIETPEITENCMTEHHTSQSRANFMCANSRMLVKQNGKMQVYTCTLVDDDPSYNYGSSLSDSLTTRTYLKHHRCFSCFNEGASCSEI